MTFDPKTTEISQLSSFKMPMTSLVACCTYAIFARFRRAQDDALVLAEHVDGLDAALEALARHQEERLLALDQLLAPQLWPSCTVGTQHQESDNGAEYAWDF